MLRRWRYDEQRLQDLFNRGQPVDGDDFTDGGEMLRNLGTAIAYADRFLARTEKRLNKLAEIGFTDAADFARNPKSE